MEAKDKTYDFVRLLLFCAHKNHTVIIVVSGMRAGISNRLNVVPNI